MIDLEGASPKRSLISHLSFLLILFLLALSTRPSRAAAPRFLDLTLTQGQAKSLRLPQEGQIHLSRKGTIDILWLEPGKWRLTGLKKGTVLLRVTQASGQEIRRVMITVKAPKKAQYLSSSPFQKLLAFTCKTPGIRCRRSDGLISGHTESWSFYLKTQALCKKAPPCRFEASLGLAGKQALLKDLKTYIHHDTRLSISSNGKLMAHLPCTQKDRPKYLAHIERLTETSEKKSGIGITCNNDNLKTVTLKTKVFYLKEDDLRQLGLDIRHAGPTPLSKISAFIESHEERIISSPEIELVIGKEFAIKAGGEVHYPSRSDNTDDLWKAFGVMLSGSTTSVGSKAIEISYTLQLKLPGGQGRSTFQGSNLTSHSRLSLGHPKIVGEVEAEFLVKNKKGIAIIEHLPIIGPLFTWHESKKSKSRMYLWLSIEKLLTKGND